MSVALWLLMLVHTPAHIAQPANSCQYVVQPGDWLSRISVNWQAVATVNHLANPNRIYPGQVLDLCPWPFPKTGAMVSAPSQVAHAPQQTPQPLSVTSSATSGIGPCHSADMWAASISQWTVPPSCYGAVTWTGDGDCYGLVRALYGGLVGSAHSVPRPGAIMHIAPGVQGAGSQGHYAIVVAMKGSVLLIYEENMYWRGGGYNLTDYRYFFQGGGVVYYY